MSEVIKGIGGNKEIAPKSDYIPWTKLDDDTVKKLEEAFSIGADVSSACFFANITRQTYYNWIKDDNKLKQRFDGLREKPVLKAFNTVYKDLDNVETAKWYLQKVKSETFGDKTNLNVTNNLSEEDVELKRRKLIELEDYVKADTKKLDTEAESIPIEPTE